MRTLKFFIIFGSLFLYSCTSSPNHQNVHVDNRYVINGVLKGGYEDYFYISRNGIKDSTLVTEGVFCFEGEVSHPMSYDFNLRPPSKSRSVQIEAGEIDMRISSRTEDRENGEKFQNFFFRKIEGTKSYLLGDFYSGLYSLTKDHPKQDSILLYTLDSLADLYPRYELVGNRVAELSTLINDVKLKNKLNEVYNKLDSSAQDKYWRRTFKDNISRLELVYLGNQFPGFELIDQYGNLISLSDLKAKVTLVDFWATWCGPCIHKISEYRRELAPLINEDFQIVSIALDNDKEKWQKAIKDRDMNWGNLIDTDVWDAKLVKDLYIDHIPVSYVINRNGAIIGYKSDIDEIKRLLRGVPD